VGVVYVSSSRRRERGHLSQESHPWDKWPRPRRRAHRARRRPRRAGATSRAGPRRGRRGRRRRGPFGVRSGRRKLFRGAKPVHSATTVHRRGRRDSSAT
jgi:hypothetical protein